MIHPDIFMDVLNPPDIGTEDREIIITEEDVNAIIANLGLATADSTFFTKMFGKLKHLDKTLIDDSVSIPNMKVSSKPAGPSNVLSYLAHGSYGAAFKSKTTNRVYKQIIIPEGDPVQREKMFQETFLEVVIQTLVSSDPLYGDNIAKIFGLYRNEEDTFIMCMEYIELTFEKYIKTLVNDSGKIEVPIFLPILENIATVVDYLQKKYSFFHRDLHALNVMFKRDGTLKIIDFGFGCVHNCSPEIKDDLCGVLRSYSTERAPTQITDELLANIGSKDTACASYDMLLFLGSLYQNEYMRLFSSELKYFLNSLIYIYAEYTYNIFLLLDKKQVIFHQLYYNKDIMADISDIISANPTAVVPFKTSTLKEICSSVETAKTFFSDKPMKKELLEYIAAHPPSATEKFYLIEYPRPREGGRRTRRRRQRRSTRRNRK